MRIRNSARMKKVSTKETRRQNTQADELFHAFAIALHAETVYQFFFLHFFFFLLEQHNCYHLHLTPVYHILLPLCPQNFESKDTTASVKCQKQKAKWAHFSQRRNPSFLLLPNRPIRGLGKPLPSSQPCSTVTHVHGQNSQSTILPLHESGRKLNIDIQQNLIGASSASELSYLSSSPNMSLHVAPFFCLPTLQIFYIYPHTSFHTGSLSLSLSRHEAPRMASHLFLFLLCHHGKRLNHPIPEKPATLSETLAFRYKRLLLRHS